MTINFESTLTEAELELPILDANEERLVRELRGAADFSVDGLNRSLLSRLLALFGVR